MLVSKSYKRIKILIYIGKLFVYTQENKIKMFWKCNSFNTKKIKKDVIGWFVCGSNPICPYDIPKKEWSWSWPL